MVLDVSVHDQLAQLLWACVEQHIMVETHGRTKLLILH
jgi:hypothetical protein